MADNVTANSGSGGAVFATDDISSVHYPRNKLTVGADGTNDGDVCAANPLPIGANTVKDGSGTVYAPIVDADGHLQMDVLALPALAAGTNLVGKVGIDQTTPGTTNGVAPISGQAGVAGGAGAVGATVQRMTLASDDPAVALLGTMDADTGAIKTAVEIMDDWDESDRCMVNMIVGQAGVAAGAGAVGATVPRMTLASDDPGVALLGTIDADTGAIKTAVELIDNAVSGAGFNVTQLAGAAVPIGAGTEAAAVRVTVATDSTGVLTVDGTITASNTAGNVAHDAADSGNPLKTGGKAESSEAAAVADGDRVDFVADLYGRQIVSPYAGVEQIVAAVNAAAITDTTSTQIVAAQAAGVRFYCTSLTVTNSHATVGTLVQLTDGSAGTVLWQGYAREDGGGATVAFPTPIRTTAATALHAVCGTTGANVYVAASGFKGA